MLIDLEKLLLEHNANISGVIHIGAHHGQEFLTYEKLGISKMVFFEPLSSNFQELKRKVPKKESIILNRYALGEKEQEVEMFVETANKGQSSSILQPHLHTKHYPHIRFETKEKIRMKTLDSFCYKGYNLINIDVQGYELNVFRGATETLKEIDFIYTEVNKQELYKNCAQVEQLDAFLGSFGFERKQTTWRPQGWGDAFYSKS